MISDNQYEKLCELRDNYNIIAIKAEFEAEGSSFRDVVRLRSLTRKANVDLYLKISGTEAVRDLKDALELDVDGIIVPMVENVFSVKKFFQAFNKIYDGENRFLTANIESKYAINNIRELLDICDNFSNITIGRTDLSDSFNKGYNVDCKYITNIVIKYGEMIKNCGLLTTLGGSVSETTISLLNQTDKLTGLFDRVETRKVVIPMKSILKTGSLRAIFEFEKLCILSKKEIHDIFIDAEIKRLVELERRLK